MPRLAGTPKTGGRKRGTPNRRTLNLAHQFEEIGFDVPARLLELLPELPAKDQANILIDLMGYLYPKRKAIELTEPVDPQDLNMTITFVDSDGNGGIAKS